MVLSEEVLAEVRFWKENVRKLNGQKIRREAGVQVVQPRMLYSDAGGHMAGGCMIVNKQVLEDSVFQVNLAEEEVAKSSTYRELRGIEEGFKALGSWIRGKGIRWHCANWSDCKIVEYGSMKPGLSRGRQEDQRLDPGVGRELRDRLESGVRGNPVCRSNLEGL